MLKGLTLAALTVSAATVGAAHAQSAVTLYGVLDNGIEYQNGGAGSVVRAESSGLFATVYGMKGREDIGGGYYVNFQLEQGFSAVTGSATVATAAFNRLAWIGVSGGFGELRFGRQKKPEYLYMNAEMDPSAVKSIASPINNFQDVSVRANNAIAYFTPAFAGVVAQFMVAMRDATTKPSNGFELYNTVLRYVNGPLHATVGYERWSNAAGTSLQKVLRAATSYRLGAARFYLAFQSERQEDNSDSVDIYQASTSYMFNPFNVLSLMYGYAHDRSGRGNNAEQIGLLYEYLLSKRTILYTAAGLIQNRNHAQYTLDGTQYSGIAVVPGQYARGVIVGITQKF